LKEDQAQKHLYFSTEFALRLMGDVQEYILLLIMFEILFGFISGYHIAEAGASNYAVKVYTFKRIHTYVELLKSRNEY
jgi:methylmalonyl-CoA mutase